MPHRKLHFLLSMSGRNLLHGTVIETTGCHADYARRLEGRIISVYEAGAAWPWSGAVSRHDPATALYRVVTGCVKFLRSMPDGRCQILRFCGPGQMFGWNGNSSTAIAAEAVK